MNGTSQFLEASDPALALTLNPLNSEARANDLVAQLNAPSGADAAALRRSAEFFLASAPGDARAYSLLGEVEARSGDTEAAERLFTAALAQSKTEIHALSHVINAHLADNDIAGALPLVDLLLRRWPEYWNRVAPVITAAMASPEGQQILAARLAGNPPWRGRAMTQVLTEPAGLRFARDLVLAANASAETRRPTGEVNAVVTALARAKAPGEAYRLFLATLPAEEQDLAGYVFDSSFARAPGGRYFGWSSGRNSAIETTWPARGDGRTAGLRLRFLDSPAPLGTIAQNLALPAGDYQLEVEAAATSLNIPKRLYWRLTCSPGAPIVEIPLESGTYGATRYVAAFTIAPDQCAEQKLSLETDVRTTSWRDRYSGVVVFDAVRIVRGGQGA